MDSDLADGRLRGQQCHRDRRDNASRGPRPPTDTCRLFLAGGEGGHIWRGTRLNPELRPHGHHGPVSREAAGHDCGQAGVGGLAAHADVADGVGAILLPSVGARRNDSPRRLLSLTLMTDEAESLRPGRRSLPTPHTSQIPGSGGPTAPLAHVGRASRYHAGPASDSCECPGPARPRQRPLKTQGAIKRSGPNS